MATPGDLVCATAAALGLPEATVSVHDRNLAIAGLRKKGGRGNSAAKMGARDAANLLTAVMASDHVKDSADTVSRYERALASKNLGRKFRLSKLGISEFSALPPGHSFLNGLAALIEAAISGSLQRKAQENGVDLSDIRIKVEVETPRVCGRIIILGLTPTTPKMELYDPRGGGTGSESNQAIGDLEQLRRVSAKAIFKIADVLAGRNAPPPALSSLIGSDTLTERTGLDLDQTVVPT